MSKYKWLMKIDMYGTHYYIVMNPRTRTQKQSMIEEVKRNSIPITRQWINGRSNKEPDISWSIKDRQ